MKKGTWRIKNEMYDIKRVHSLYKSVDSVSGFHACVVSTVNIKNQQENTLPGMCI